MDEGKARILVVDDEPFVCDLLCRWLSAEGHECDTANSGEQALIRMQEVQYDLVVSDIMMHGMSGIDLLTFMHPLFPDAAILMVTAVDDRKTAVTALELGAYGYIIKPFERNEILINVDNALERRRLTLLSKEQEKVLSEKVALRTREVHSREEEIIFRLLSATGFRDDETGAHVKRIGLYAYEMALNLGWKRESAEQIRLAAPMHDIGKIGIPDDILLKPGRLTPPEFEIMKRHVIIGAKILDGSDVPLIQMARDIAMCHHERYDGSGYPRALSGDAIPLSARIVAVVDVYDALVHNRVYRRAFSEEEALALMVPANGAYFGDDVFDAFISLLPVLKRIREQYAETEETLTWKDIFNGDGGALPL
jgi:putative two-component system response regulator